MKLHISLAAILLLGGLLGCKTPQTGGVMRYKSDNLEIEQLTKNTFRHVSYLSTQDFGKVGCNGMIVINQQEALVFDTPVHNQESGELIDWITQTLGCRVVGVVATHFHEDCLGGLPEFHARQIPSYASLSTIALAQSRQVAVPQTGFADSLVLRVGNETVVNAFFGEGHTIDNIVAYFPKDKVLFGGCLVKAMGATKGFLGDANTAAWSNTVRAVRARYGGARVVIPGHGRAGNANLLDYTIQLFEPTAN